MLKIERRGKKGIYWAIGTINGERIRQSLGVDTKEQAEAERLKLEQAHLDEKVYGKKATATFADAIVLYKQKGGKPRFLNPLVLYFGNRKLAAITDQTVSDFIQAHYPKASPQTINRQVYTPLIAVWRVAWKAGLCAAHTFTRPGKPKKTKAVEFMRDDQLAILLASADQDERAVILFLSFEGGRNSEVCRVKSDDIDWEARTVHLPDTKGDPRLVVLPPLVYDALVPLRGRNPLFGCKDRWALNRMLARACKRAGLPCPHFTQDRPPQLRCEAPGARYQGWAQGTPTSGGLVRGFHPHAG
jgi:integrase